MRHTLRLLFRAQDDSLLLLKEGLPEKGVACVSELLLPLSLRVEDAASNPDEPVFT